jgi:peptidyl-prolyl cis-trans isomerase D
MRFGPTFEKTVFSLPTGDWSEPIQSTSGWHRVRVIEETPARLRSFEEVQAEVEADLRRKLREDAYNKEIERLSKKFTVKISP